MAATGPPDFRTGTGGQTHFRLEAQARNLRNIVKNKTETMDFLCGDANVVAIHHPLAERAAGLEMGMNRVARYRGQVWTLGGRQLKRRGGQGVGCVLPENKELPTKNIAQRLTCGAQTCARGKHQVQQLNTPFTQAD